MFCHQNKINPKKHLGFICTSPVPCLGNENVLIQCPIPGRGNFAFFPCCLTGTFAAISFKWKIYEKKKKGKI